MSFLWCNVFSCENLTNSPAVGRDSGVAHRRHLNTRQLVYVPEALESWINVSTTSNRISATARTFCSHRAEGRWALPPCAIVWDLPINVTISVSIMSFSVSVLLWALLSLKMISANHRPNCCRSWFVVIFHEMATVSWFPSKSQTVWFLSCKRKNSISVESLYRFIDN